LGARDLKNYDYIKSEKKVEGMILILFGSQQILILHLITEADQALNPLKGINIDAAGGAGKVLRMVAEKVSQSFLRP
jgi:peptidyl-prolyl cis-trans isomerase-like protein 2